MYNVIYIDAQGAETPIAQDVGDRGEACALARTAAAERHAGRAVSPGSTNLRDCVCVVPTPHVPAAA
jgi:hypothetical protein